MPFYSNNLPAELTNKGVMFVILSRYPQHPTCMKRTKIRTKNHIDLPWNGSFLRSQLLNWWKMEASLSILGVENGNPQKPGSNLGWRAVSYKLLISIKVIQHMEKGKTNMDSKKRKEKRSQNKYLFLCFFLWKLSFKESSFLSPQKSLPFRWKKWCRKKYFSPLRETFWYPGRKNAETCNGRKKKQWIFN